MACPLVGAGQSISEQGGNYEPTEQRVGDQTFPQVSVGPQGGLLVWQDNGLDNDGSSIGCRILDANFSGSGALTRVNQLTVGDQVKPQVALADSTTAAVVWEGGRPAYQNIYVRFFSLPNGGMYKTDDIQVNTWTNAAQSNPQIARLADGNLVMVWESLHQDGDFKGVFGRVVGPAGNFVSPVFEVNQFISNNQRSPEVVGLANGNFAVVWISENQRVPMEDVNNGRNHADLYARIFGPTGVPVANEVKVNSSSLLSSSPSLAPRAEGGFTVAWAKRSAKPASWDIYARNFSASGVAGPAEVHVNNTTFGDQYEPQIATVGANQFVVWTSLAQDGFLQGVYGRLLVDGVPQDSEFRVNSEVAGRQYSTALASDNNDRFLAVWMSDAERYSFDFVAQRYSTTQRLGSMSPPWLSVLSENRIIVSWPIQAGISIRQYEVWIDNIPAPAVANSNSYIAGGFSPASSHAFRIGYVLTDGQRSPLSEAISVRTWDQDRNGDGIPDDWQANYWGPKDDEWPSAQADADGDGASNYNEFLAGTSPVDAQDVLVVRISRSPLGRVVRWNTTPGSFYQVQSGSDLLPWANFGEARLAPGTSDSIVIPITQSRSYFRVMRVR